MKKQARPTSQKKQTPEPESTKIAKQVMTQRLQAQQDLELRRGRYKGALVNAGTRETYGGGSAPFTPSL